MAPTAWPHCRRSECTERDAEAAHARQGNVLMGIKCGIVGLPNVGKSTLFNALTKAQIAAENYPFCTIEPNVGVVGVPDPRLEALAAHREAREDHAGGDGVRRHRRASSRARRKGEGLGNQFLAHIRETDAIAHVVRCFENDDIVHVAGRRRSRRRHRGHRHRARARRSADASRRRRSRGEAREVGRQGSGAQARPAGSACAST